MPGDDVLLVACMKDEGPFILEWVAFHQSIGVDRFIVVTNDCTDGTDAILDRLDDMGIVRHLPNPSMMGGSDAPIQKTALMYAALQREFRAAAWILVIDADEFLNLAPGAGTIPELMAAVGDIDAISFNQVAFGNAGVGAFVDAPVTSQFTMRHRFEGVDPVLYPRMQGIKTLARNDPGLFPMVPNHRPRLADGAEDRVRWLDGSGRPMHPQFFESHSRAYPVYAQRERDPGDDRVVRTRVAAYEGVGGTHALGYVNHYALRSLESFVVQRLRGDAVNPLIRRDADYWTVYDRNEVEDLSIQPRAQASRP